MRKFTVIALAGLVTALVAGAPGSASARLDLCQAGIQKEAKKYVGFVELRLQKCVDFIRKERDFKGGFTGKGDLAKAAGLCEKQLVKLTDLLDASGGKDAWSKLQAGLDKLIPTKCEPGDLEKLGHLVSGGGAGGNAPPFAGGDTMMWVKLKIKVEKLFLAWWDILEANVQAAELIEDALRETREKNSSFPPVDCKLPSGGAHPNLCGWSIDTADARNGLWSGTGTLRNACYVHGCQLDCVPGNPPSGSFSTIRLAAPGSDPTDGTNVVFPPLCGSAVWKFCNLEAIPRIGTEVGGDFMMAGGGPTITINTVRLDLNRQVCVRGLFGEGWCDCGAGSGPVDVDDCIDHIVDPNGASDTCGATQRPNEEECYCSSTPSSCGGLNESDCIAQLDKPCRTSAVCDPGDECKSRSNGAKCHPNTFNSAGIQNYSGASVDGDCVISSQIGLTVTTDNGEGTCVNGGGNEGEDCTANSDCDSNDCLSFIGLDGVACTDDDTVPRGEPGDQIFTTGTANARVEDALYLEGACVGGSSPGVVCIEDSNCPGLCTGAGQHCLADADCDTGETCDATPPGTCTGVGPVGSLLIDRVQPPVSLSGTPIDCSAYRSSLLSGWIINSVFPFADGAGLGDGTAANLLICQ
jgi:hypothetical protein